MYRYQTICVLLIWLFVILGSCSSPQKNELKWYDEDNYKWAKFSIEEESQRGFVQKQSSSTGVYFENNLLQEDIFKNRHYLNGSGVALGDVDGDGWTDIYFAQLNGPNKLYKNRGGFRFEDITDSAGVAHEGYYSTGVTFADIDGDGDLDLLVTSMEQENVIYINDGQGKFTRQSGSGLSQSKGSHTMALADIDEDGDLDLYVTNYKKNNVLDLFDIRDLLWDRTIKEPFNQNKERTYSLLSPYDEHYKILYKENALPDRREVGRKDELFINEGDGTFKKANLKQRFLDKQGNPKGLEKDWGLTAKFHDINQDGLPDLYVCNDFWTKDRIWINQGKGIFKEMAPLAISNMSFSAMGVDFSDIDRDGFWDIFVTEMLSTSHEGKLRQFIPDDPYPLSSDQDGYQPQYNRNSLYLNRGDNTFTEISYYSGLEASDWSWATRFLDVDLDGYEDLLITTGYSYDVQDLDAQQEWRNQLARTESDRSQIDVYPSLRLPNRVFKNNRIKFEEVSAEWGFNENDISHGLAVADLDHDGDLDLVTNRLNQKAAIYENKTSEARIAVRLIGKSPNTQAIGSKVKLQGGPVTQMDEISAGGDYLSHSDPLLVFAAKPGNSNHELTITWADGKQSILDSLKANRIYKIDEEVISKESVKYSGDSSQTIFKDVSERINHEHHEEPYDDFRIQPLLPIKLSKQGPGVSWIDFDSDGDDDLFITSGRGGNLSAYENENNGEFQPVLLSGLTDQATADQTTILGWGVDQQTQLFLGQANYEPGNIKMASVESYSFQNGEIAKNDSISGIFSTTGPMAAADYEGDGDIDLFVGGRFVPTQYPANATSRVFKKEDGRYVLDKVNSYKFENIGLVTGAIFSDFDQDGDQDLFLSQEWGMIKLFENRNGEFFDISKKVGLDQYKGWWNGIATGDFNNDGRPDIVATNMGTNSPYQIDHNKPLKMFYYDFNNNGRIDIIESYFEPSMEAYVPRRQLNEYESISNSFSSVVSSNKAFANATLNEILRVQIDEIPSKKVNTLEHTVFINERDFFSGHTLPEKAQYSAAFYAGVADFDNDGNEDIFLSQNFYQVRPKTPRLDGGRGLWIRGDGNGNFEALPGNESGIKIYGEQRGAALGDFNSDGKVDLVVSQNNAETKLYLNQTNDPGLTIKLEGPPENRDGIGSSIRLVYEDGTKGPRREIQVGSGYWSQNSTTQIMGVNKSPVQIEVLWFDGHKDIVDITNEKRDYKITYPTSNRN